MTECSNLIFEQLAEELRSSPVEPIPQCYHTGLGHKSVATTWWAFLFLLNNRTTTFAELKHHLQLRGLNLTAEQLKQYLQTLMELGCGLTLTNEPQLLQRCVTLQSHPFAWGHLLQRLMQLPCVYQITHQASSLLHPALLNQLKQLIEASGLAPDEQQAFIRYCGLHPLITHQAFLQTWLATNATPPVSKAYLGTYTSAKRGQTQTWLLLVETLWKKHDGAFYVLGYGYPLATQATDALEYSLQDIEEGLKHCYPVQLRLEGFSRLEPLTMLALSHTRQWWLQKQQTLASFRVLLWLPVDATFTGFGLPYEHVQRLDADTQARYIPFEWESRVYLHTLDKATNLCVYAYTVRTEHLFLLSQALFSLGCPFYTPEGSALHAYVTTWLATLQTQRVAEPPPEASSFYSESNEPQGVTTLAPPSVSKQWLRTPWRVLSILKALLQSPHSFEQLQALLPPTYPLSKESLEVDLKTLRRLGMEIHYCRQERVYSLRYPPLCWSITYPYLPLFFRVFVTAYKHEPLLIELLQQLLRFNAPSDKEQWPLSQASPLYTSAFKHALALQTPRMEPALFEALSEHRYLFRNVQLHYQPPEAHATPRLIRGKIIGVDVQPLQGGKGGVHMALLLATGTENDVQPCFIHGIQQCVFLEAEPLLSTALQRPTALEETEAPIRLVTTHPHMQSRVNSCASVAEALKKVHRYGGKVQLYQPSATVLAQQQQWLAMMQQLLTAPPLTSLPEIEL